MGYPVARSAAAAPLPALSSPAVANSLAAMFAVPITGVSANDASRSYRNRRLGLSQPLPLAWVQQQLLDEFLMQMSKALVGATGVTNCSVADGSTGAWAGGSCLFPFHLVQHHSPPSVNGSETQMTGSGHVCVPNGAWFPGQTARLTTQTFSGTLWQASSGQPRPKVFHYNQPVEIPAPLPWWAPAFNPWYLPINKPVPEIPPVPATIPRVRPDFDPDPSPVPSPRPAPRPRPGVDPGVSPFDPPAPGPRPLPPPQPRPGPAPAPDPDPDPIKPHPGRPLPQPAPNPYGFPGATPQPPRGGMMKQVGVSVAPVARGLPRPPPKGRREMKARAGRAVGMMWAAVNIITEVRDFVKAGHKAMPKRCPKTHTRRHGAGRFSSANAPTVQRMASEIYQCVAIMTDDEHAEMLNRWLDNFIEDQVKDYAFGKTGQALAKSSARSGRPVGYGAGPAL